MNDDIVTRLQRLPPALPTQPDRFERVRARVTRRRRHHAVIGSALAAALIVAGVSMAATTGSSPSRGEAVASTDQTDRATPRSGPAATPTLSVTAENLANGEAAQTTGSATWDEDASTITYLTRTFYNQCPPMGSARRATTSVTLVLAPKLDRYCKASPDATIYIISGLTEAPSELTVTEDGETMIVPIQ